MNFETSLQELYFNLETLNIVKSENNPNELSLVSSSLDYSKDLTNFLVNTSPSYLNSVIVRLKLFNKLNKSYDEIMTMMEKYPETHSLVNKLFSKSENELKDCTTVDSKENIKEDKNTEENSDENLDENLEEKIEVKKMDEESEEDNPFLIFYNNKVKETNNKKDVVKTSEFYNTFRKWYTNTYDEDVPSKKELKVFLGDKLGKSSGSKWQGVVLSS
jgi:hypothetical protein